MRIRWKTLQATFVSATFKDIKGNGVP